MPHLATVAAFGFPDFHPPVILDLYRRLGCVSCQFYRNPAFPPPIDDALRITSDLGLPIDSIHGLFGPDLDPSSPDESRRAAAVETYRQEGLLALQLRGPMVVVHPSPILPASETVNPADRRARLEPFQHSLHQLAEIGAQIGVVYLIENLTHQALFGHDPLQLAQMIRAVNSPHLRMCFDTGHALCTGSIADRLLACADVIRYLHIHDNDSRSDSHLMPGDGVTDWPALGRALADARLEVPAMLEVFYLRDRIESALATGLAHRLATWINSPAASANSRGKPT